MDNWTQYNIFIIPIIVGAVTQFIKFVVFSLKHGWNIRYAMTHGHMPSAHTAFIVSLVTTLGIYEGFTTGAFAVAVILAVLVIDDAVRIRVYLGDQGRYLNMLVRQLNADESQFPRLKERIGHQVSEVIIGGVLGLLLTAALIQIF
ncbi:MAG: divergent PAP2 family protein [Candidatus Moranbacteria bacterium]|nr:divergent PAP2 family protein [Candidatus Moranbacteria bacterium]